MMTVGRKPENRVNLCDDQEILVGNRAQETLKLTILKDPSQYWKWNELPK